MAFDQMFHFVQRLQKEAIGEPQWIQKKQSYEYKICSAKTVAVLKVVRAAQGVATLDLLCRSGLFIDFGVIVRCVNDCVAETYFLLEDFPKSSKYVDQFVKAFFESTIDGYLASETPSVPTKKIKSAMTRVLTDRMDDATRKRIDRMHKTFSGYVHTNYAHTMEIYNGQTFDLGGCPSIQERHKHKEHVVIAWNSVMCATGFAAHKFGIENLYRDIVLQLK